MAAVATKLLKEQIALARKILSPDPLHGSVDAQDIMRLARLALELHHRLSTGTPFPAAWLSAPSKLSQAAAPPKDS